MNDESVFLDALEVPVDQRTLFVVDACGVDDAMRRRVLGLLAAHENPNSFLTRPADVVTAYAEQQVASAVTPGDTIGVYTVRESLGEGGMGSVFVAEQEQPVRRRVAIKIIKPGMDTRQVIARFGAERQTLALMDHPNIAKVIDAGSTLEGRPFFVMELIRGIPITEYCDQAKMTTRDRLELFTTVCAAVEHAHQKGIIHRDLKPSNVLITEIDGRPVAKVIDFGISKATGGQVSGQTLYSNFAQIIGTPLYMSPEQTSLSGVDVDTRSDVYSLGVMFYELITGTTPFAREQLKQAGPEEMCRMIREVDPPRPSARLSTLEMGDSSTISENRQIDHRKLKSTVKGELDWIAMKALDKDRNRRYGSANAVAADIHRYLDDAPVEACPPSTFYRLRKFGRRNRSVLSTMFLLAGAMAIGLIASVTQAVRATYAEGLAETRLLEVDEQRQRSQANFALAMQAMDEVYIKSIGVEKLLRDPRQDSGTSKAQELSDVEREMLQRGLEFYDRFAEQNRENPDAAFATAGAFYRVALLQIGLEQNAEAEEALGKAIERFEGLTEQYPEQSKFQLELGKAYFTRAKLSLWWPDATAKFEAAKSSISLAIDLDSGNAEAFKIRGELNDILSLTVDSIQDFKAAAQLDPTDAELLWQIGRYYTRAENKASVAIEYLRSAIQLEPQNQDYVIELARVYWQVNSDPASAAAVWQGWLPYAPHPATAAQTRATISDFLGKHEDTIQHIDKCISLGGDKTIETNVLYMRRGSALRKLDRNSEAKADLMKSMHLAEAGAGNDEWSRALTCVRVGEELTAMDEHELAIEAYNASEKFFPNYHILYHRRGKAYENLGQRAKAISDYNKGIELNPSFLFTYRRRGEAYEALGEYEKARVDYETAVRISPTNSHVWKRLAAMHFRLGDYRQAAAGIAKAVDLNPQDYGNILWLPIDRLSECPDPTFRPAMLATAKKLIEATQGSADSYAARGVLHYGFGDTRASVADLIRASNSKPELFLEPVNWFDEGLVNQSAAKDYRDAVRKLLDLSVEQLVELNYDSYNSRRHRLVCLLALGDVAEAMSEIGALIEAEEATHLSFYYGALIAAVKNEQSRYRELCSQMQTAFADSDSADELYFVAWSIGLTPYAVDDYAKAEQIARRAIKLDPQSTQYWLALASVQLRSGESLEALSSIAQFEDGQAIDDTPDAYVAYLRAITEFRLKRTDKAKVSLARAIELGDVQLTDAHSPPTWNRKMTLELFRREAEALAEKEATQQ